MAEMENREKLPEAKLDGVSGGWWNEEEEYYAECPKCGKDVNLGWTKVDKWTCTECGSLCRIYKS